MKVIRIISFFLLSVWYLNADAQIVSNIKPAENAKMGDFTEWQKVQVSFENGNTGAIEYRIGMVDRKGIACHYELQVKNVSEIKFTVRMKSSYYDKLVKGNFGEEIKETLKPGKSVAAHFVAQGCKKEKGKERSDFEHCYACDFGVDIYVIK